MRIPTIVAGLVAGAAGLAGAVAGYQQLAASPRQAETVKVTTEADVTPRATPPARVRLRDCPRGFDLRGRTCIRVVQRTVVIDVARPAPAAPAAPAAAVAAPSARRSSDAPATHDVGDDQGGRGGQAGEDHGGRGDEADGAGEDHSTEDSADHAEEDHHGDEAEDGSPQSTDESDHHGEDEPDD